MIENLNRNDVASIRRANMTLETFKKKLKKNQEKMAAIDEEFRLKAEKKKASLVQDSTQLENTISFWSNSTVQLYGKPVEELMEMILTEEEPPLIIHNKETGEEEINPEAVAPEPEVKEEEVVAEEVEPVEEPAAPVDIESSFEEDSKEDEEEEEEEEEFSEEDFEEEEEEPHDPTDDEDWSNVENFEDEWK